MAYMGVPGTELWYADQGTGDALVFLHPMSGSSAIWAKQIPIFIEAGFRCISYDRRGLGQSTAVDSAHGATASDDLSQLLDFLDVSACHLVAAAGGGETALDFALSYPDRTSSLVLSASHGGLQDDDYLAMQKLVMPPELLALPWQLLELTSGYRAFEPEGVQAWTDACGSAPDHAIPRRKQLTSAPLRGRNLQTIDVPVLLIAGGADWFTPPVMMRNIQQYLQRSELRVIAETGHAPHWERPSAWNKVVLDFLARFPARHSMPEPRQTA